MPGVGQFYFGDFLIEVGQDSTGVDNKPVAWLMILVVFSCSLACLRIARAIWALENVISLITAPSKASLPNPQL